VLDAGCGTGGNLRFLQDLLAPSYLGGFDISELALRHARRLCPEADIYNSDIRNPRCHRRSYDLIISCDVLYTAGLNASLAGMQRLVAALAPGGLCIVHLPAYRWLTSSHDRAVHTSERFVLSQLRQLFNSLGLVCLRASYRLCCLLPLVALKRCPSLIGSRCQPANSDLQQPAAWLNNLLFRTLQVENRLVAAGACLPWGSSIFAVGRKVVVYNEVESVIGGELELVSS
jgi:SAM-dependent methyltransferase